MNKEDFVKINRAVSNVRVNIAFTDGSTFFKGNVTTTLERLALRLKLKELYGSSLFDPEIDKLEQEYLALKTKVEQERALKEQKEREEWLKQQKKPLNRFLKILRNNWHLVNPEELDAWLAETTVEQRKAVLEKYKELAKKRGLGLRKETVEFGLAFLQSALSLIPNQSRGEKKPWRKLKLPKLLKKA